MCELAAVPAAQSQQAKLLNAQMRSRQHLVNVCGDRGARCYITEGTYVLLHVLIKVMLDTACVRPRVGLARAACVSMRGAAQVRELVDQTAIEDECLGHGARPAKKLWCAASHSATTL